MFIKPVVSGTLKSSLAEEFFYFSYDKREGSTNSDVCDTIILSCRIDYILSMRRAFVIRMFDIHSSVLLVKDDDGTSNK